MKLIRTRTGQDGDLRSWRAAEFGRKGGRLNAELLQRIFRNKVIRATSHTDAADGACGSLTKQRPGLDTDIRADSIYREVIRATSLPIHTELSRITLA